jgi:glycosyltransferase involved in cell wall biosynthesis
MIMNIAIMMRPIDQENSGFHAFMKGLIENMLKIDRKNTYLLLYRTNKFLDYFSSYKNAKPILVKAASKLLWDQIAVPYVAWKHRADIIFNPKFSVPLISHCPVVMGLHEPAWWVWPQHYEWWDVRYIKTMLPLYCRKSAHFFSWSRFTIDENQKYLGMNFDNATVLYPAPNEYFHPINDRIILEEFRNRYQLPDKFILGITRVEHVGHSKSTSFYAGKNVETTLRAFALIRDQIPHRLVIAGRNVHEHLLKQGWNPTDLEGVHFTGFVPHEELPKLYNLAQLFVIPSFYESFAYTLVEAMTCGCPIIASQTGACPEISSGAALLANPYDPTDFAQKMLSVINNTKLWQELRSKSLKRASFFNWERAARLTLEAMAQGVASSKTRIKWWLLSAHLLIQCGIAEMF